MPLFLKTCDKYGIQYQDKLAQLARIEIVNTLPISQYNTTLGMLKRNQQNEVVGIEINWMAQIDPTILKIVSFHEFAHYFLEYEGHPCDDCLHIMGARNTNYFEIAQQWEAKLNQLFNESPAFLNKHNSLIGMGSN